MENLLRIAREAGQDLQWADSDRCCAMHISTLRADCGPSLRFA
jgi:hypothetical protein